MVSVIIPTYNAEKTIKRAIDSVLSQNEDVEILICDDCSTDSTLTIALHYGLRLFQNNKHTGGPNAGRNIGIKAAKGEYIAFLDQDDEWLPGKLKKQLEVLKDADLVSSQSIIRVEKR